CAAPTLPGRGLATMMRPTPRVVGFCLLILMAAAPTRAGSRTVAQCGAGFLEEVDGSRVLHVRGTPYEVGYQQGGLLRDDIREQVRFLFDVKAKEAKLEFAGVKVDPKSLVALVANLQKPHVPPRFYEEIRGVADGSGMAYEEVLVANFIPELFHCSG